MGHTRKQNIDVRLKTAVAISRKDANALCKAEGGFNDDVELSIAVQIGDDDSISGLSNVVIRLDSEGPTSVTQQDADIVSAVICDREICFPVIIEISESAVIGITSVLVPTIKPYSSLTVFV